LVAGADFIKTSTGKEGVNAILPVALVMLRAIRDYFNRTGYKVIMSWIHGTMMFPSIITSQDLTKFYNNVAHHGETLTIFATTGCTVSASTLICN
jgi:hypothetical protein